MVNCDLEKGNSKRKDHKPKLSGFEKAIESKMFKWWFSIFNIYKGLPRSIYILFVVKVINAMGNFVFPFLAIYLTKKLSIDAKTSGAILTVAALSFAPGAIIGGKMTDRYGRKKVFAIFQTSSVILFIPCAFLSKSLLIPFLLIVASFFNGGSQPPLSAMANDLTNQNNRKQSLSLLYLGNNIGFAFGSMIAGFLFTHFTKLLFIGNFVTGFAAVIILLKLIKESKPDYNNSNYEAAEFVHENEKAEAGGLLQVLLKRPIFLVFALLSAVYSFVYAQFPFCGSIEVGPQLYGVLMSLNGFVVITMTTIIIRITNKIKPLLNMAFAGVFFAVGFGMLYFIKSLPMFIISTIIWTIGEILNATNSGVYIANNTPSSHRGRFNSAIQIITGSGFALGPILMGMYISGESVRYAWPLVFIVELLAALMIFSLYLYESRKVKPSI